MGVWDFLKVCEKVEILILSIFRGCCGLNEGFRRFKVKCDFYVGCGFNFCVELFKLKIKLATILLKT